MTEARFSAMFWHTGSFRDWAIQPSDTWSFAALFRHGWVLLFSFSSTVGPAIRAFSYQEEIILYGGTSLPIQSGRVPVPARASSKAVRALLFYQRKVDINLGGDLHCIAVQ